MDAMPLISLSGLHKHYGAFHALRGINLEIEAGEFFSLLGPSGCGKTTLLRTIAGFETPSSGDLKIGGQNVVGVPANQRPTNMVFQSYAIFPHLSVAENVGFGLRRLPMSKVEKTSAVGDALEMVGLGGLGARSAQALSGGQRQRVALARALILKPKVLLLDEPLSALDKKLREHMQVELIKLQRQVGITFILVTHDQEEALVMSDRIAVMFDGQIAQIETPERLYSAPATRQVAEFIGSMNFVPGALHSDGTLEIAGLGKTEVAADQVPSGITAGSVTVGVRPETMTLLFEDEQCAGISAQGTIDEVVYYGDMTYYDLRLEGSTQTVRIAMRNIVGRPVLEIGSAARINWDPRSLVLFPAE